MQLFNTLTKRKAEFAPEDPHEVKLYTCGPTVYHYVHIGNLRNLIFNDSLRRTLRDAGYGVRHVLNITDVGHLTSDADEGEDKLEKGAIAAGKTVWEVADFYIDAYEHNAKELNILPPSEVVRATAEIKSQIELVEVLLDKKYAYITKQAIYFDVTKFGTYGELSGQKLADKEVAVRSDVISDAAKHHPQDFALWFFKTGHFANHTMFWPTPWGDGFPGWHLECSAIIHKHLGETIDIHTGGIDHIGTHHTNEIAQSESAYQKPLAAVWMHNEFLLLDSAKIAKSAGNSITLQDIKDKGYVPVAFRLLMLMGHYRSQQNFTWVALEAAQNALNNLYAWADLRFQGGHAPDLKANYAAAYQQIRAHMADDLNSPAAMAVVYSMVTQADSIGADASVIGQYADKLDELFGLNLSSRHDISLDEKRLLGQRNNARQLGNWAAADKIRLQLLDAGLEINDGATESTWRRTAA